MASLFDQVTGVDTDRQICLANGHQKSLNSLIIWMKITLQRRGVLSLSQTLKVKNIKGLSIAHRDPSALFTCLFLRFTAF